MTGVLEFFMGFAWGTVITACLIGVRRRRPHRWRCPECTFNVRGSDQGLVDYVILEHSALHEAD